VIRSGLGSTIATHDSTTRTMARRIGYPLADPVTA